MKRMEWEFSYKASDLHAAAEAKHNHHLSRCGWWTSKRKDVEAKIKSEGIEIDVSLVGQSMISNTAYRQPTVCIRDDLMRDMQECVAKAREHEFKAKEYDGWIQVLKSQGSAMFPLHHEDWMFFFGK